MSDGVKNYIELGRTFYELPKEYAQKAERDDLELSEALGLRIDKDLTWEELLKFHRIVLLAEAGSGKTEEIRQATKKLRSDGKQAYFLRLEHISAGLEAAFEEGSYAEFNGWIESNDNGWLFLDSVDEARLKSPLEFEEAIRIMATHLRPALQRVHIVITGRVDAWRPKTDLALCERQLPYKSPTEEAEPETGNSEPELGDEVIDVRVNQTSKKEDANFAFKVFSLNNLSANQIHSFAAELGVPNISEFLNDIERHDAWSYTERPQDLIEITDFWIENERIGSRLELILNSIERRLKERRENAAASSKISLLQLKNGARLIAAASTLSKEAIIRIPDGSENTVGLNVRSLLPEWDREDCAALLSRPIFDEAIYGAARFHHRSAREFLTAEWLFEALVNGAPRKNIESLFFKKQYGIQVLVPSMRPVLSWLVLFDDRIRKKACKIEPEVIFEGGDPSKLPLRVRDEILRDVCNKMSRDTSKRSVSEYTSVQRFANPDLASTIKSLMIAFRYNTEVTTFLLRMIWQGRIKEALPEAKSFAWDNDAEKYARIAAIRALEEIGSEADFQKALEVLLVGQQIDRFLLAEVIALLKINETTLSWVFTAIEKASDKKEFTVDSLGLALVSFAERLEPKLVLEFVTGIDKLLSQKPFIEHRHCNASIKFAWLVNSGAKSVKKLLASKHTDALEQSCLSLLCKIPPLVDFDSTADQTLLSDIAELVEDWDELKFALFWKGIEILRADLPEESDKRLTDFWQAYQFRSFLSFGKNDFSLVAACISERVFLDDKLVALSLAFQIYRENGRPRKWRERLKKLVADHEELNERLTVLLNPPPQTDDEKRSKRRHARWQRQREKRKEMDKKNREEWCDWLKKNSEKLKDTSLLEHTLKQGSILNAQSYLLDRMRELKDRSSHWAQANWYDLQDEFGVDVANAFRDGAIMSWRYYTPVNRSEREEKGGTSWAVILGLVGLEIEANETPDWPKHFDKADAALACRYAFQELNGFPDWLPKLHQHFSDVVIDCVLKEVEWELSTDQDDSVLHYVVDKLRWNGSALWGELGPRLIKLIDFDAVSQKKLGSLLQIINGSSKVTDEDIIALCSKKCSSEIDCGHLAHWFATWIGVEPGAAIQRLTAYLNGIEEVTEATNFAMMVVVNLMESRTNGAYARDKFIEPQHLKTLYLLMHKFIKTEEDIERAGKGAYSPGLRDDAQEARDSLFAFLKEKPGEETYKALLELAQLHPTATSRPWMKHHAHERAEKDSDFRAMTVQEFLDYQASLAKPDKVWNLEPNIHGIGVNLRAMWGAAKRYVPWLDK